MKHKRVLFGLLAAVAAMMFLFCGDSVVTTGNGNEVPGTTPGNNDGGEVILDENAFVLTNTSKGISVTNREKYIPRKAAAVVADINQALKTIQGFASSNAAISIQFGSGGTNALNIGTVTAVIGKDWAGEVGSIKFVGVLNGKLDISEAPIPVKPQVTGSVTFIVDPTNPNIDFAGFIPPPGSVVDANGNAVAIDTTTGVVVAPPVVSKKPVLDSVNVWWATGSTAGLSFTTNKPTNVWLYVLSVKVEEDSINPATIKSRQDWKTTAPGTKINATVPFSNGDFIYALIEGVGADSVNYIVKRFTPDGVSLKFDRVVSRGANGTYLDYIISGGNGQPFKFYFVDADTTDVFPVARLLSHDDVDSLAYDVYDTVSLGFPNLTLKDDISLHVVAVNKVTSEVTPAILTQLAGDKVAPTLEKTTGTSVGRSFPNHAIGTTPWRLSLDTVAYVKFSVNETSTVYGFIQASSAGTPAAAEVKAKSQKRMVVYATADSVGGIGRGILVFDSLSLNATAAYKVYVVAEDAAGNISAVGATSTYDVLAKDVAAPDFTLAIRNVPGTGGGTALAPTVTTEFTFADLSPTDTLLYALRGTELGTENNKADSLAAFLALTPAPIKILASSLTSNTLTVTGRILDSIHLYAYAKSGYNVWGGGVGQDSVTYDVVPAYETNPPTMGAANGGGTPPTVVSRVGDKYVYKLATDDRSDVGATVWRTVGSSTAPSGTIDYNYLTGAQTAWTKAKWSTGLNAGQDKVLDTTNTAAAGDTNTVVMFFDTLVVNTSVARTLWVVVVDANGNVSALQSAGLEIPAVLAPPSLTNVTGTYTASGVDVTPGSAISDYDGYYFSFPSTVTTKISYFVGSGSDVPTGEESSGWSSAAAPTSGKVTITNPSWIPASPLPSIPAAKVYFRFEGANAWHRSVVSAAKDVTAVGP
jgi:hypothetical protein